LTTFLSWKVRHVSVHILKEEYLTFMMIPPLNKTISNK